MEKVYHITWTTYNMEKVYHITWTTYNSRVSERMKLYKVKASNKWIYLDENQELEITRILQEIFRDLSLQVYAYNICNDHIHLLMQCTEKDVSWIMRIIKWKSVKMYKDLHNIGDKIHLWWQKFNQELIKSKIQLINTIEYIEKNRIKHWLERNIEVEKINFCTKVII